jgi:ribosome-associated protein
MPRRPYEPAAPDAADDEPDSGRSVGRHERREAGEDGARLAKALMEVAESALDKLGLDDDLRAAIDRARAVTSKIARRRAERGLSGDLRRAELGDLEARLASVRATGAADTRLFKLAESWRARLIAEGSSEAQGFPGGARPELMTLVHQARRERDSGKPPGAGRALFRHVMAVLEAEQHGPAAADDDGD